MKKLINKLISDNNVKVIKIPRYNKKKIDGVKQQFETNSGVAGEIITYLDREIRN